MNSIPVDVEIKKNLELTNKSILRLKEWVATQPHLPCIFDSDLALFLHKNDYSVEDTKNNIENFFTMRSYMPEFFADRDPIFSESLRKIFKTVAIFPLNCLTTDGHKVVFAKLIDSNVNNYKFNDAVKLLNMVLDLVIYEEGTNDGFIFVFDLNGASVKHILRLSIISLKRFFDYTRKGTPVKFRGLHYINTSRRLDRVQQFVKSRIVNRFVDSLYLHSSMESFMKIVPKEALPDEFGGKAGSLYLLHQKQIDKLESYRRWFINMESYLKVNDFATKE